MSGGESEVGHRPLPSRCVCCGAYSLQPDAHHSTLLAVCDVLIHKSLEAMGKYIVRTERSRYRTLATRPWHVAHTLWAAPDRIVDKALKGAWDVVPVLLAVHGCCDVTSLQVTRMLDRYVHDLVVTGTAHDLGQLIYRFEAELGLPVYETVAGAQFSLTESSVV